MSRIQLPNGCLYTEPFVHPFGWDLPRSAASKTGITTDREWYIKYRFYDPNVTEGKYRWPIGRQVVIKRMNRFKTLKERREATATLLANELDLLINQGYNPILNTKKEKEPEPVPAPEPPPIPEPDPVAQEETEVYDIEPTTPFIPALQKALELLECSEGTKDDVAYSIPHMVIAIRQLGYDKLHISGVKKKHINFLLRKIGKNKAPEGKETWSNSYFNHYRSYLIMLFKALDDAEAIEADPTARIRKKKVVKGIRPVLTPQERKKIKEVISWKYPRYWRFLNIFFHSGARITELMRMKTEDVELDRQRFKVLILKGQEYVEDWKIIKDIALPFWLQLMAEARPGQYLFAKYLKPGDVPINEVQISRRWTKYIKKALGVKADCYSLKHLNTTEVLDILEEVETTRLERAAESARQAAAKMNSHRSTTMNDTVYDVNREQRKQRKNEAVLSVANAL